MKLVTYRAQGETLVGALTPDGTAVRPLPYPDMNTLIETVSPGGLRQSEASGAAVPLSR